MHVHARRGAERLAQPLVAEQPGEIRRECRRVSREQSGRPVPDDVARPARVHRRDGHAEGRGFDQHAAERLRSVRRKGQQRRVPDPRHRFAPRQPAQHAKSRPSALAPRPPAAAQRAVARHDERPGDAGVLDRANQVLHALVDRESCRRRARTARRSAAARVVARDRARSCRPDSESCRAASRPAPARARARSRAIAWLDGDHRRRARQRLTLGAQVRSHVRNQRPGGNRRGRRRAA